MRYAEGQQGFPEEALRKATFGREGLSVSEHFFVHGNVPHLTLVLSLGDVVQYENSGSYKPRDPNAPDPADGLDDSQKAIYRALKTGRNDKAKRWVESERELEIKTEATVVAPESQGVPFLGLRIWPNCWRLRRERFVRSRQTWARRVRQHENGVLEEERLAKCASASDGSLRWFGFKGILTDFAPGREGAASGSNRVQRGGNWNNDSNNARSSNRNNNNPDNRNNNNGLRLSSTLAPGSCQSPARDARAAHDAQTKMQCPGWPVAQATATSGLYQEVGE